MMTLVAEESHDSTGVTDSRELVRLSKFLTDTKIFQEQVLSNIMDADAKATIRASFKTKIDLIESEIEEELGRLIVKPPSKDYNYVLRSKTEINDGPVRLAAGALALVKLVPLTYETKDSSMYTTVDLNDPALYDRCVIEFEKFSWKQLIADKLGGV
jgi:hypothetical protein